MAHTFSSLADKTLKDALIAGQVGVIPTDTLYGLVCSAKDKTAVSRLYKLKTRGTKPGTVIAASIEQLAKLGIKPRYLKAVEQFWPNPLSIVLPCGDELSYLHLGAFSLAVRMPKDKELNSLLEAVGPLLTTSANRPGEQPAGTLKDAKKYFGETVDFYAKGGDLSGRQPSTVIRVVDDAIEVLRPGAVIIDRLGRLYDEPKNAKSYKK